MSVFVCLGVYMYANISQKLHVQTSPDFFCARCLLLRPCIGPHDNKLNNSAARPVSYTHLTLPTILRV